jgi:hypothetical protein
MIDRREARRQAKERVTAKGILVVRCTASGEILLTFALSAEKRRLSRSQKASQNQML